MTLAEALANIEMRGRGDGSNRAAIQEEGARPDTRAAVWLLAAGPGEYSLDANLHGRREIVFLLEDRRERELAFPSSWFPNDTLDRLTSRPFG
jgi:hypothetical protein